MMRVAEVAGSVAMEKRVRGQHRHGGALDPVEEWLDAPIEFMIPNQPGVVTEEIEELDHHPALIGEGELRALIDVADVDQERVGIFLAPAPDLGDAARHPAKIAAPAIIDCRQNVTVQISRVQNGNGHRIGAGDRFARSHGGARLAAVAPPRRRRKSRRSGI